MVMCWTILRRYSNGHVLPFCPRSTALLLLLSILITSRWNVVLIREKKTQHARPRSNIISTKMISSEHWSFLRWIRLIIWWKNSYDQRKMMICIFLFLCCCICHKPLSEKQLGSRVSSPILGKPLVIKGNIYYINVVGRFQLFLGLGSGEIEGLGREKDSEGSQSWFLQRYNNTTTKILDDNSKIYCADGSFPKSFAACVRIASRDFSSDHLPFFVVFCALS